MNSKTLSMVSVGLVCLIAASVAIATDDWDDSHLVVARNQTHPIDQVIFLTDWGVDAARKQLERWEADPEMHDRLMRRPAYREYLRRMEEPTAVDDPVAQPHRPDTHPVQGRVKVPVEPSDTRPSIQPDEVLLQPSVERPSDEMTPASDADDPMQIQVADLQQRMERLESAYSTLSDSHHASLWDIDLLKAAKEELELRVQDLARKYSDLLERHEDLRDRYELLAGKHAALEAAYADVVEQLESQRDTPATVHIQPSVQPPPKPSKEAKRLNEKGLEALDEDRAPVAVRWFLQAHQEGSINAANNLGFLYEHGWGTVRSASEAYLWYKRAAEAGHPHGMRNLARFYEEGRGVTANPELASFWRYQSEIAENDQAGE